MNSDDKKEVSPTQDDKVSLGVSFAHPLVFMFDLTLLR